MAPRMSTPKTTGREMIRARFKGLEGFGATVGLRVGAAIKVVLKMIFVATGNGWEGIGGCKQDMWRVCMT